MAKPSESEIGVFSAQTLPSACLSGCMSASLTFLVELVLNDLIVLELKVIFADGDVSRAHLASATAWVCLYHN
jgi:hypothetical protein